MADRCPISVFIIAKNEADRIEKPLLSVKDWVDEVIVIDSGSTDDTVKIAESHGATVLHRDWEGYGPQKVYGEAQCRNDWILNIDADEEVSETLANNIRALFDQGSPRESAFWMKWKLVFPYEQQPPAFAPVHRFIRLYNKKKAGFKDSKIHDSVVVHEGKVGKVDGLVRHRSFRNLTHQIQKINEYSTMQAQDMIARGRKPYSMRIIAEPFLSFLKLYIMRGYIRCGMGGFIASVMYAYSRVLRLAKARELYLRDRQG